MDFKVITKFRNLWIRMYLLQMSTLKSFIFFQKFNINTLKSHKLINCNTNV